MNAMRHGMRPDGANYFPSFPYPSFTLIADSRPARHVGLPAHAAAEHPRRAEPHDLRFPFGWRFPSRSGSGCTSRPARSRQPAGRRPGGQSRRLPGAGARAIAESATRRATSWAAQRKNRFLAGGKTPEGKDVSNLTPANLKKWSDKDLADFLTTGTTPDGDVPAEAMGEVIRNTTSQLTPQDLAALIAYLRTLPPVADEPAPKK